jgi:hypothetical protein
MNSQEKIANTCDKIKNLLLEKNKKYGNSAISPLRVFSKASPVEQILVRIDDKLSRIKTSGLSTPDEDTLQDLIGYLVLLTIAIDQDTVDGEPPSYVSRTPMPEYGQQSSTGKAI